MMRFRWIALAGLLTALPLLAARSYACPFCAPVQQTFAEEIDAADVVVIAELIEAPAPPSSSDEGELQKSKFKVVDVIKGESHSSQTQLVELLYFGEGKVGGRFLMLAVDPPNLAWSTPTLLSDRSEKYIRTVVTLPKDGPKRLAFFQDYLEDKDEMLARDAYDEFARASYDAVIELKDQMNHDQLVAWIKNPDVPASRRRLYLTMLGVCGDKTDADMLEGMLRSDDRKLKAGLDALIACFLRLRGAEGLPLIEDLYLKNKDCEYADTYSAIMALRFHGQETDIIPQKRIVEAMHHMLDRPELADLVIVDLARWEDWSVMDRLVELFKKADEKSSWVRVPVVRYLMACPKPEAKKHLKELEKIDEGAVRRAKTFFPFDGGDDKATSSLVEPAEEAIAQADGESPTDAPPGADGPADNEQQASAPAVAAKTDISPPASSDQPASSDDAPAAASGAAAASDLASNTSQLLFVMFGVIAVIATVIVLTRFGRVEHPATRR